MSQTVRHSLMAGFVSEDLIKSLTDFYGEAATVTAPDRQTIQIEFDDSADPVNERGVAMAIEYKQGHITGLQTVALD